MLLAVLALVALVGAAACSTDDVPGLAEDVEVDPDVEAGDSTTSAAGEGDAGAPAPGGGEGTPGGDDGAGEASGDEPAPTIDDHGPVGAMGPVLLRGGITRAVVEIDRVAGVELAGRAENSLVDRLGRHGGKEASVVGDASLSGREVWSDPQIRAEAEAHRDTESSEERVSLHLLVLDGRHENESVLGVALDATTMAVFPEQIDAGLAGLADVAFGSGDVEEAVAVHELGHLFGLVDLTGQGDFHEDPEHPHHSTNQGSVMYWAVETDAVTRVFEGGPPTTFDEDDEREMARIRSQA